MQARTWASPPTCLPPTLSGLSFPAGARLQGGHTEEQARLFKQLWWELAGGQSQQGLRHRGAFVRGPHASCRPALSAHPSPAQRQPPACLGGGTWGREVGHGYHAELGVLLGAGSLGREGDRRKAGAIWGGSHGEGAHGGTGQVWTGQSWSGVITLSP